MLLKDKIQIFCRFIMLSVIVRKFLKLKKKLYTRISIVIILTVIVMCFTIRKERIKIEKNKNLNYILIWTSPTYFTMKCLGSGQNTFIRNRCSKQNCYVSSDRQIFDDTRNFSVVIFLRDDLNENDLPSLRSEDQKFVFASMESAGNYPVTSTTFNNYFNWTWTYKLNSDEQCGYISIRDDKGAIIGPKEIMHWKKFEEMDSINDTIKTKLSTKKYAAAWFVSNCVTQSKREIVAQELSDELAKRGLILDIFGYCGKNWLFGKCSSRSTECLQLLEQDYYFYLSFENSFSLDYVTEKLLRPLKHYTVPIVFGGANYTRFMPEGIYLDAKKMSAAKLAEKMAALINNKEDYYNYFKWHNHYSYHDTSESPESDSYCKLCSLINQTLHEKSIYNDFQSWWNT